MVSGLTIWRNILGEKILLDWSRFCWLVTTSYEIDLIFVPRWCSRCWGCHFKFGIVFVGMQSQMKNLLNLDVVLWSTSLSANDTIKISQQLCELMGSWGHSCCQSPLKLLNADGLKFQVKIIAQLIPGSNIMVQSFHFISSVHAFSFDLVFLFFLAKDINLFIRNKLSRL